MTTQETIAAFDVTSKKDFDEHDIHSSLETLAKETSDNISTELTAELLAFAFDEVLFDNEQDSYYGPCIYKVDKDGERIEYPSTKSITPEILSYWERRISESTNPVLKARYSGLVWGFQKKVLNISSDHQVCRTHIEALVEVVNDGYCKAESVYAFNKLKRALSLSVGINSKKLIEVCKKAIINCETKYAEDGLPSTWGHAFDLLIDNKKVQLSDEEEQGIIQELENRLNRTIEVDTQTAEHAAIKLAKYYKKKKNGEDVKRVLLELGKSYEKLNDDYSTIQQSSQFEHLYKIYDEFGLKEDADQLLVKIRELGPKSVQELQPISQEIEIPKEVLEAFVAKITAGEIEDAIKRIIGFFTPRMEKVKEQLARNIEAAPFLSLIPNHIVDDDGRVVSIIGSLEDDLEGNIIHQISTDLRWATFKLRFVLQEMQAKFTFNTSHVIKFLEKSPAINVDDLPIIEKAIDAYFANDYITMIHLLIPQMEKAIRKVVELNGCSVLKPSKYGGYDVKTLGELLRDESLKKSLGDNYINYLKVLLADPRGWNLRNGVCHGLINAKMFNIQTADRLLHALLFMGTIRMKEINS